MTLSIIALIVSVVCLTAGITITYKQIKKKRNQLSTGFIASDSYDNLTLRTVKKDINILSKEVQPLIDRYKEEQKQKLIETRKAHWKSFNTWKFHKGMFEEDFEKDKNNTVCGECLSDGLKLTVDYKQLEERNKNGLWNACHIEEDYPISAELKCTVCNHVADRWEYKK